MPTAYITVPPADAATIAETLVEERLAACVNRVSCRSTYRWDGDVTTDDEEILIAKTTSERYEAFASRVRDIHPYDVPCIERFDESAVDEPFAEWCRRAVSDEP